ncbi:hypothetical protein [Bartonella sp. DGB1]|uniref:hypothetical protein n=1 Tax=Bartonella sp. DGB1 TaxID=3239807 RepID=UPI003524721F
MELEQQHVPSTAKPAIEHDEEIIYQLSVDERELQLSKPRKHDLQHCSEFISNNEIMDLNEGMIPYFYRNNQDRNLYHISGAVVKNADEKNLKDELIEYIDRLPEVESLMVYIQKAYDSVRSLKTVEDLQQIMLYHAKKDNISTEIN